MGLIFLSLLLFQGQIERLKDSQEDAVSDRESHIVKEQRALESVRKSQREVRELREEMVELQRKEADVSRKKEELVRLVFVCLRCQMFILPFYPLPPHPHTPQPHPPTLP